MLARGPQSGPKHLVIGAGIRWVLGCGRAGAVDTRLARVQMVTGSYGCWATDRPLVAHHVARPVEFWEFGATWSKFLTFVPPVQTVT